MLLSPFTSRETEAQRSERTCPVSCRKKSNVLMGGITFANPDFAKGTPVWTLFPATARRCWKRVFSSKVISFLSSLKSGKPWVAIMVLQLPQASYSG